MSQGKRILYLTLKKKWFDMIFSGEKKEEYRDIKPFWASRLTTTRGNVFWEFFPDVDFKDFDIVEFKHGYAKNAPTMQVECLGIEIGTSKRKWSEGKEQAFIIKLGKILFHKNCRSYDSKGE